MSFVNGSYRILYQHQQVLPFEKGLAHPYWRDLWRSKWHLSVAISVGYFFFIKLLQWVMQNREPFKLKKSLILWNGSLAIFSVFGVIRTWEELLYTLKHYSFYHSLCYTYPEVNVSAYWYFFFSLSKIWELGDTVFLALRKRPLSFLHCYHHMSVLVYTFQSGAEQMAAGRWFICMNLVAHSFMYTYYTAMSLGCKVPKPFAVFVTCVQITQMLAGVAISCAVLGIKTTTGLPCEQSWANMALCFSIYVSYTYLFLSFFRDAYINGKKQKSE